MIRRALLATTALVLPLLALTPAAAAGSRLCLMDDPRLSEVSGIAARAGDPRFVYVQNDSNDSARFFAVDTRTGRTAAVYTVPGASNVDWEDLAVAPDAAGRSSVWLADVGDNQGTRSEIDVYRIPEPARPTYRGPSTSAPVVATARPAIWRLRYPDGAHDAESIAVDPTTHHVYIATKSLAGVSEVFELPERPDPSRRQLLSQVGTVTFRAHGHAGPFDGYGQFMATGAAISGDGRLLVFRTYADAYIWPLHDGDVQAALRITPVRIRLPNQPQGEGVDVVGGALWLSSEGRDQPITSVRLPRAVLLAPTTAPSHSSSSPSSSSPPPGHGSAGSGIGLGLVAIIAAAVLAFVLGSRLRRRSRHKDQGGDDLSWTG
jgi:hypothetical protein